MKSPTVHTSCDNR